jgi:peptidoglycan/LPS O-acetylase OafA/YrhL
MLAGPETQLDEPGRRSPRKRINAILAVASLLAGFALLAALFEPDGATQEFIILSVTATIGATIAFSRARNEQMAAVLTAALGVAAIVLGITAVASHLYSWLLRAEGSEWRHLHGANSDQFAIYKFSSRHNMA